MPVAAAISRPSRGPGERTAAGRMTTQVLPDGQPTYFLYDALGRRLAVTDALGSTAYFHYDAAGQQTASVDALGYVTYYYYDDLGRQHAVRDPADGLVYYAYRCLCQVDLGARGDFVLSSISLS
jgi:YD repeat-containing protein